MKKLNQAFFTCFVLFSMHLFSQNLLTNGDFESGGAGSGFTVPNYNLYTATTGDTYPGSYAISNNPSPLNQYFISPLNDHTAGAGNTMMVVDGHTNSNASFWSAGDNASGLCGLTIGASYTFSYWIRTISSTTTDATTQPNIVVNFGNATGTIIYGNPTADLPTVGWQQVMYTFVPSATCVTINLVDVNTSPGGNDFALDDLEVVLQLCAPTVLSITNPDAVCSPNTIDITDPAITVGSIGGGTLTYWTDAAGTIPLVTPSPSAIDVSGTYYIRSSSGVAPNCNDIQPVLVTVKPITTPIFTPVPDICEGEVIAPLPTISDNGVVGTWSPAIDNTTTTTYTFTPDPNPNPNLVLNGDFSQGNSGFSSSYTHTLSSDGTVVGVYGVTTNSSVWFNSLSSCNDNTGGGNFLVADASVSNGGNDSVWCQTIPIQAGENYIFSYFAQSVSSGSPANLEVTINGVVIGNTNLGYATCNWTRSSFPWNSGTSTSAVICIYDKNTAAYGNDFGIDDISFVPTGIQCAEPVDMTIVVNPSTTPTFDPVAPICAGDALAPLPTTSLESITGTWSPALDNTTTTIYTFTPDAGQCATTTTLTSTVNPGSVMPTFDPVAPICSGETLSPLPTTSLESITGTWSPALDNTTTTTYTFTPDAGQCTSSTLTTVTITVNPLVTPTFTQVAPICSGETLSPLPTTSLESITGSWSPALDTTTTTTYTFTPDAGQCADSVMMTIVVNSIVTPTFTQVAPICSGDALAPLPTTSLESITGTWSPALDNTATTTYTFTPDAGQCADSVMMTIVVNPIVTPTFSAVAAICSGDALASLPTTSLESITGTWSPVVDNTATTTYTFTPDAGQCTSSTVTTITITVNPIVTPTFTQVAPICSGETLSSLPTTSLESITGTWSPALDNTTTTTYTFTPDAGQCADSVMMTIVVNSIVTPTFTQVAAICSGDALAPLSTTSIEGITGTWSPVVDNTVTTTYTFTPDAGQCASSTVTTLTITVNPIVTPTFDPVAPICSGDALAPLSTTSIEGITGTWSPVVDNTATTTYTFTPDAGQCTSSTLTTVTITVNPLVTPTFTQVAPICSGETLSSLPTTSTEGVTGTWSPALDNTRTTTYTFTPDAGQCAEVVVMTIVVNTPIVPSFTALQPICSGETAPVLVPTSIEGITGSWNPAVVNNTTSATYTFTPDAGQCAVATTLAMTINQPTLTNVTCAVGEPFSGERTITVYATSSGNYEYQLDDRIPQLSPVFENVAIGTHTITVTDLNGCSASITTEVIVLDYPKFFTPNGDGINDNWNIVALSDQPDARIFIFDRYGKLLKQLSTVGAGWDGTFNGEQLPSTDYWFTVDYLFGESRREFKAHFSLKR